MTTRAFAMILVFVSIAVACGDDSANSRRSNTDSGADAGEDASNQDVARDTTEDPSIDRDSDSIFNGVTRCDSDAECDDGLACTSDACVEIEGEGRVCQWQISAGTCLIGNNCYDEGDTRPEQPCQICDPATPTNWANGDDGSPCDDGNSCTSDTTCLAGVCGSGGLVGCDDDNPCTVDSCSPDGGCVNDPVSNTLLVSCDDQSACTVGDICVDGLCEGSPLSCDDGNVCTDDSCDDATGCINTNNTASCDDGDPCTVDEVCDAGSCGAGQPNTCEDFNECTIDTCDPDAGCINLPTQNPCCIGATSICDDGDPCTTDLCDPTTAECAYENNTAPCDDSDACTVGDTCNNGSCEGTDLNCDDNNQCTMDSCNPGVGCVNATAPLDGTGCDDGATCSTGDMCSEGSCNPTDTSMCVCNPTFDDSSKVTMLALGADTSPGEALDIDNDGVRDNTLGPLGTFLNDPLAGAVDDGSLNLLLEFIGLTPGSFTLALHQGELDPGNTTCDYQNDTCNYIADRALIDPDTCEPVIQLAANRNGNDITAGGPTTNFPFSLPLDENNNLNVILYQVNVELTITLSGDEVVAVTGILGAAITESELIAAILSLDPDSLPLPPDTLIGLLDTLAPNDIDTDGDNVDDAKSISLKLDGIDGIIVGATDP